MNEKREYSWNISTAPEITYKQVREEAVDSFKIVALEFIAPIFPSFLRRRIEQKAVSIANKY